MKIWLNRNFGFIKGELNGLVLLILIIALLKSFPFLYDYYKPVEKDDQNLFDAIQKIEIADLNHKSHTGYRTTHSDILPDSRLFRFDPNTIDVKTWQILGLSLKQAQSIINYRSKGGRFYKAEDLQRMYTITPRMYKKLLPYIEIRNEQVLKQTFQREPSAHTKKGFSVVELNLADSAQLDGIKGIGPAFAARILKYRKRLGGFYKKEQLMEVYGLDSIKYAALKDQVSVNPSEIKMININTADFNVLKGFPYLSYKQINAILQYRKQHGNYGSAGDLKNIAILSPEVIDKILPYLSF